MAVKKWLYSLRFFVAVVSTLLMVELGIILQLDEIRIIRAVGQAEDVLNWDFESGDIGGWTTTGQVQVITDTIDLLTDNAMHTVAQGQYAIMVGDHIPWSQVGDQLSSIERTISVPPEIDSVLQLSYAVVANDPPSHSEAEKPYFSLQVRDLTTNEDLPVSDLKYTSQTSQEWFLGRSPATQSLLDQLFSFVGSDRWVFIPWRNETIDLKGRAGHRILVRFSVRDCNPKAHAAYGYLDNIRVGPYGTAQTLPSLLKQPQPAGVPLAPGWLAKGVNLVERYAFWPWCLFLPLLLLGLLYWLYLRRRRIFLPPDDSSDTLDIRTPPRRASQIPINDGQSASWRDPEGSSKSGSSGSRRR